MLTLIVILYVVLAVMNTIYLFNKDIILNPLKRFPGADYLGAGVVRELVEFKSKKDSKKNKEVE